MNKTEEEYNFVSVLNIIYLVLFNKIQFSMLFYSVCHHHLFHGFVFWRIVIVLRYLNSLLRSGTLGSSISYTYVFLFGIWMVSAIWCDLLATVQSTHYLPTYRVGYLSNYLDKVHVCVWYVWQFESRTTIYSPMCPVITTTIRAQRALQCKCMLASVYMSLVVGFILRLQLLNSYVNSFLSTIPPLPACTPWMMWPERGCVFLCS